MKLHEIKNLIGNFLEGSLGKLRDTALGSINEGHELDDITASGASSITKSVAISIKDVHGSEVTVSDTHDNDGERLIRGSDESRDGLIGVANGTIGDDEQDGVVLVVGAIRLHGGRVGHLDQFAEVGGTGKLDIDKRALVGLLEALDALNVGVGGHASDGEAVGHAGRATVDGDPATEAVHREKAL